MDRRSFFKRAAAMVAGLIVAPAAVLAARKPEAVPGCLTKEDLYRARVSGHMVARKDWDRAMNPRGTCKTNLQTEWMTHSHIHEAEALVEAQWQEAKGIFGG